VALRSPQFFGYESAIAASADPLAG
jgi:hypothetical protein